MITSWIGEGNICVQPLPVAPWIFFVDVVEQASLHVVSRLMHSLTTATVFGKCVEPDERRMMPYFHIDNRMFPVAVRASVVHSRHCSAVDFAATASSCITSHFRLLACLAAARRLRPSALRLIQPPHVTLGGTPLWLIGAESQRHAIMHSQPDA